MKRLLLVLCMSLPFAAYADIIVTRSNGNIEDVKVVSMSPESVLYTQDGQAKSIQSSDVDGVLYDDGRYVTPPSASQVQEQPMTNTESDSWDEVPPQSSTNRSTYTSKEDQRQQKAEEKKRRQACWKEALSAYQSFYDEAYQKALQQGLNGPKAKKQAGHEAWATMEQMVNECMNGNSTTSETKSTQSTSYSGDNW